MASLSSYHSADDYFIETDERSFETRQKEVRRRAKAFAEERQKGMAEMLSQQAHDDYADDILDVMEYMETLTIPDVSSIDIQTEIQWFMRPFLLDFLIEAHAAFRLLPETLYLAINLLDRYCSKRVVYKKHYQLVGCACLFVAAKYGDKKEHVPRISELKSMCCGLYEEEMFTQMEWHVLQTLDWSIGHPTIDAFLQIILAEDCYDAELEHMTWYLCEISLFHREFVAVLPSVMARTALALARYVLSRPLPDQADWSGRYDYDLLIRLSEMVYQPSPVVLKKFASPQFSYVSNTMETFLERQRQVEQARQQAEQARQAAEASLNFEIAPMHEQVPVLNNNTLPITPIKPAYALNIYNGLATPPITPENDLAYAAMYGKAAPPRCPTTPTPPSSFDCSQYQPQPPRYGYGQIQPAQQQYYMQ